MMRIQVHQSATDCVLKVEGEIEGLAVQELEKCWHTLACNHSAVVVDFRGVLYLDRGARSLLKSMHAGGVAFIGARLAVKDILDQITAPASEP